jgi:glucose/arabinose dehydrogenase
MKKLIKTFIKTCLFVILLIDLFGAKTSAALTDEDLKKIRLPSGFEVSLFSDQVAGARSMTLSPSGTLYVGTREDRVYAIPHAAELARAGKAAAKVITIAKGLHSPNGVAFKDESLYVAEVSRILKYPAIEKNLAVVPQPKVFCGTYPKDEHHGWKFIAFGPDGWLYVPVGAPCNRCLKDEEIYASITRLSPDGKTREIFARGVRNTVGFAWHPKTHELWMTDNGADYLGDNVPGDELNRAPKPGLHFGYPYCHQGTMKDPQFGKNQICEAGRSPFVQPMRVLGPHVAALGMRFYDGTSFPEKYRGGIFIAEHGSWNRTKKSGYRVTFVSVDEKGASATGYEPFAEGWLQGETPWGRPVDVQILPDGSMLISDDMAGAIYRIAVKSKSPNATH